MTLLSMTGFGEARVQADDYAIAVELRSVNSRYFKLHLRTTEGYAALDAPAESAIRNEVKRGTVYCNIRIRHIAGADDFRVNTSLLSRYVDELQKLAAKRELSEELRLEPLAALPGVIEELSSDAESAEQLWPVIEPALQEALGKLSEMRKSEGVALAEDLTSQCDQIGASLKKVEARAPEVSKNYRRRLQDRVGEALSELNVSVEPADLIREVSLFADRCDISEETVRLASHLEQFNKAMHLAESSGRKLEFICQEMGRETNTIGSKANDVEISEQVVEIKTALERIREQIQNVQ